MRCARACLTKGWHGRKSRRGQCAPAVPVRSRRAAAQFHGRRCRRRSRTVGLATRICGNFLSNLSGSVNSNDTTASTALGWRLSGNRRATSRRCFEILRIRCASLRFDRWKSLEAYQGFRSRFSGAYAELDARCQHLTKREASLGEKHRPAIIGAAREACAPGRWSGKW
jgi:hypothetical protein